MTNTVFSLNNDKRDEKVVHSYSSNNGEQLHNEKDNSNVNDYYLSSRKKEMELLILYSIKI